MFILTDGEPRRPNKHDETYGKNYTSIKDGERLLAGHMAEEIKKKDITVVVLAVGKEATLKEFKVYMHQWSSKNKYFEADFDSLTSIIDKLINASCVDPGENRGNIDQRQIRTLSYQFKNIIN